MKLPEEFCQKMHHMLGEEYRQFIASYDYGPFQGIRVNTLKISVEDFQKISPFSLTPVPWADNGFYIREEERPAKHPYYHAGLYYIQEPSAMAPVRVLSVESGDRVLDLCAAPGGKSTQIASELRGFGLLVSNDISSERTKALTKNIELSGTANAIVLNESPEKLAAKLPGFFTKILIDAPCSGEGMFRKDSAAVRSWGIYSSAKCALMQQGILREAGKMLSPGGSMVYSTCTFNLEENERMVEQFLNNHSDFFLKDIMLVDGWEKGRWDWVEGNKELSKTARLWPHKVMGEGHFMALIQRKGVSEKLRADILASPEKKDLKDFLCFICENLKGTLKGEIESYGDRLYLKPQWAPDLNGIKVVRPGLYLGTLKKNRFEPSHSLAMALNKDSFKRIIDFNVESREIINYLKGETLNIDGEKGWTGILVSGFPVGWGKQLGGVMKNHYPQSRRIMS